METPFRDRHDAGKLLAGKLRHLAGDPRVVILALPRGGVPVGFEIAERLHAPLDIFIVRKLGVPVHEELAMGAIATGGVRVLNEDIIERLAISDRILETVTQEQLRELERRERDYRKSRPPLDVTGKTVVLVDDGLATGASMKAAVRALRQRRPQRIIIAVPVGAPETCQEFETEVDEVICAKSPAEFGAVGMWYEDFAQTTDEEVCELLDRTSFVEHMPHSAAGRA